MLGKYGVELYPKYADEWSVEGEILDIWWWWSVPQGIRIFECGPCFMMRKMNSLLSHTVISFCPSPVIWQTFIRVLVDRLLLGEVGKDIHTPCVQNGGFDWRRWDQGMASSDRTNFIQRDSGAALGKGEPKISFLPACLIYLAVCFISIHLSHCHSDSFRNWCFWGRARALNWWHLFVKNLLLVIPHLLLMLNFVYMNKTVTKTTGSTNKGKENWIGAFKIPWKLLKMICLRGMYS